jgi:hypothetical protein
MRATQLGQQQQQDQTLILSPIGGIISRRKKSFDAWGKASFGERLAAAPLIPHFCY